MLLLFYYRSRVLSVRRDLSHMRTPTIRTCAPTMSIFRPPSGSIPAWGVPCVDVCPSHRQGLRRCPPVASGLLRRRGCVRRRADGALPNMNATNASSTAARGSGLGPAPHRAGSSTFTYWIRSASRWLWQSVVNDSRLRGRHHIQMSYWDSEPCRAERSGRVKEVAIQSRGFHGGRACDSTRSCAAAASPITRT